MVDRSATISSLQSSLDELAGRVASIAGEYEREGREEIAVPLWEVERSLAAALRRLGAVSRDLT